ncbi:uncharacterized protein [Temnothorax nylanderi]|uniref:uncharacterized protein n=2 Tax=Temnothorax nylanderi TaxID=102681 RepID=UPI003A88A96A
MAHVRSAVATHTVRLLVDSGSELTFVSERLVTQLSLKRQHSSVSITGIGGNQTTQTKGVVDLSLHSTHSHAAVTVRAHILKTLTTILPTFESPQQDWPHLQHLKLADPEFLKPREIDLIIGADSYGQVIKPNLKKCTSDSPVAQLSIFGWLVLGPVRSTIPTHTRTAHHTKVLQQDTNLEELLTKFWIQEEPPTATTASLTTDEQECETHFRTTHSRDSTGRYIVRIPFKLSTSILGNSYEAARRSLQGTLKRFKRDSELQKLYTQFMQEYEQLDHMAKIPSNTSRSSTHYYLPHHGVLKPDSETTKLRVVFNGSCATSTGFSLNDTMYTGANLLLNIFDVLIWIRQHRYLFSTDITKMYRQIKVHPSDWDLQRIIWIDELYNEVLYYLTTVTYGTKAAPFLAVRTLLQLAKDEGHRFPLALPPIERGRCVDDMFGGSDTIKHLIKIAHQLRDLCNAGGFPLAKWHSNHPELLKAISSKTVAHSSVSLDDCNTKLLGLKWSPQEDTFSVSTMLPAHQGQFTKRLILSEVAQIFDPLGFLSPVVIKAKMLLQELWLHKLSWDDPLPFQVVSRWLNIRKDLTSLARLSIPRWFNTTSSSIVDLHGFSDASQFAMAAVIYLTAYTPSTGTQSTFICSKTKVAPLKRLTIPRLELTAALLLAKLMKHVLATLTMDIRDKYLWTDSQATLAWIKTHASRWKDYVRNRVSQIQELTEGAHWKYVPSAANPADCASRGVTMAQLETHALWWTGPPWILASETSWPTQPTQFDGQCTFESRPGTSLFTTQSAQEYHWDLIYRYSTLNKLLRITALCFRFCSRLQRKLNSSPASLITLADMERARTFWINATQAALFTHELKVLHSNSLLPTSHPFSRLTAFIDNQGTIRVGGRLNNAALTYEDQAHRSTMHGGTQLTLAHIRQLYWIVGGRASVKSHILRCVVCARQRGIRAHQLMGQLPLTRVTPSRAFAHTGLDYAGPIILKTTKGRGAKTYKAWICVFVCLTTSAVHLEVVSDYSTEGFISTYRRFTSRRGVPASLTSDCGTNFIGADRELRKLFTQYTQENQLITAMLTENRTQWSFNPPAAPHMGGKWEAAVKSIKFHIRRTVGETRLTFEESMTLLTQIEAVLNSRPLEPLSDDPEDISALTPGHFLIGTALTAIPEPSLIDLSTSRLSRWQFIQQKVQQFWSQWSAHYLQRQQAISKWHHPSNLIKPGSLVLLTDERFPPCKWPLARVLTLMPGKDGLTRVVQLKTATTTLTRPITKLAVLPVYHPE